MRILLALLVMAYATEPSPFCEMRWLRAPTALLGEALRTSALAADDITAWTTGKITRAALLERVSLESQFVALKKALAKSLPPTASADLSARLEMQIARQHGQSAVTQRGNEVTRAIVTPKLLHEGLFTEGIDQTVWLDAGPAGMFLGLSTMKSRFAIWGPVGAVDFKKLDWTIPGDETPPGKDCFFTVVNGVPTIIVKKNNALYRMDTVHQRAEPIPLAATGDPERPLSWWHRLWSGRHTPSAPREPEIYEFTVAGPYLAVHLDMQGVVLLNLRDGKAVQIPAARAAGLWLGQERTGAPILALQDYQTLNVYSPERSLEPHQSFDLSGLDPLYIDCILDSEDRFSAAVWSRGEQDGRSLSLITPASDRPRTIFVNAKTRRSPVSDWNLGRDGITQFQSVADFPSNSATYQGRTAFFVRLDAQGHPLVNTPELPGKTWGMAWSRDSSGVAQLIYGLEKGEVAIVQPDQGTFEILNVGRRLGTYSHVQTLANGRRLIWIAAYGGYRLIDVGAPEDPVFSVADTLASSFSSWQQLPDGRSIIAIKTSPGLDSVVRVMAIDAAGGERKK